MVNQTAPHNITVFWNTVPTGYVHGNLLGYRLVYRKIKVADEYFSGLKQVKKFDRWTMHTTLEVVDNYAVYSISVLAFTVKGDGKASEAIYAGKSITRQYSRPYRVCCQRTWMDELHTYK